MSLPVHSYLSGSRFHARMKICLQKGTKGAPSHEQKELRSSGEHRRCAFANGAGELTAIPPECAVRHSEFVAYATCRTRPKKVPYCASTTISSSVSSARCIISSMQSFKFSSWRLITARFGLVTGCFATKIVQQSSNGRIDVS